MTAPECRCQPALAGSRSIALPSASGATPFFAYDRALLTERDRAACATPCPAGSTCSYAVKANPMPAVVQHISAPRRFIRRRLGRRDARRRWTRRCLPTASASPARARRRGGAAPGDRGGSDDRDGIRNRGGSGFDDRRAPGHPAACRGARQPRLPDQGLWNADGRRFPAVRRRRRKGTRSACERSPARTWSFSDFTSSADRRT